MRVCIIVPEYFPIPAVKGGAVETLVQSIIDENEKKKELDIVCVTKYDREASKLYGNYKHTTFVPIRYFDRFSIMGRITAVLNYGFRALTKIDIRKKYRTNKYLNVLPNTKSDLYIFEGENLYVNESVSQKIGKDKMVLHLHKVYKPNQEWGALFQRFIAISKYVKDKFTKNGLIDSSRVQVVYNGIDLAKFDKYVSEDEIKILKDKYNIPYNKQIVIYTGRIFKEKGVKELVEAFKICKNKDKACLMICGGGMSNNNKSTDYINEIKEASKGYNIVFTGYIDNKDLYKYYKLAQVAVFPSLWEEGFGNVVIEAMLSKVPVIISKRGGMQELVSNETGRTVELDDDFVKNLSNSIDALLDDEDLRNKLGKKAYEFVKGFSQEEYYKNYVQEVKNIRK